MLANKMKILAKDAAEIKLKEFTNSKQYRDIITEIENEARLGNCSYNLYLPRVNYMLIDALKREGFTMSLKSVPIISGTRLFQLTIEWC